jgi:hypothetical protein
MKKLISSIKSNPAKSTSIFDFVLSAFLLAFYLKENLWRIIGHDYNWDLLNYHLNNATNSQPLVLHPAGIQSFFSPLLGIVLLPIHTVISSPFSGVFMTFPFVMNFLIIRNLFLRKYFKSKVLFPNSLALVSIMPAMAISQINNSMGDVVLTPIALIAIYFLLTGLKEHSSKYLSVSGFTFGVLLAFKLSFAYLIPPSVFLLFYCVYARKISFYKLLQWFTFFSLGYFPLSLSHLVMLHREFGNPYFPFFNKFFQSPYFDPINLRDERFGGFSPLDYFLVPLNIAMGKNAGTAELVFRDLRPLIIVISITCALLVWAFSMIVYQKFLPKLENFQLVAFLSIAYVIWGQYVGIARYLIPLEVLGLLFSVTYFQNIIREANVNKRLQGTFQMTYAICTLIFFLTIVVTTTSVNWGHQVKGDSQVSFKENVYTLKTDPSAAYLLLDAPLAFLKFQTNFNNSQYWFGPSFTEYDNLKQRKILKGRNIFTLSYSSNPSNIEKVLENYNLLPSDNCDIVQLRFNNGLTPTRVYLCETEQALE